LRRVRKNEILPTSFRFLSGSDFFMQPLLTAAHMTDVDRLTTERYGVSGLLLMENAAVGAVLAIEKYFGSVTGKRIRIFCGRGNNGGDGAAVARQLWMRGARVETLLFGARESVKGDARTNFDIIASLARDCPDRLIFAEVHSESDIPSPLQTWLHIDALFGTGLTRELDGLPALAVEYLNARRADATAPTPVCALDLPSGLAADDPNFIGHCVTADLTVTFTAPKFANVLPPACDANGLLHVVRIGSPGALVSATDAHAASVHLIEETDIAAMLTANRRSLGAHKGDAGHVLIAAGARGKTGAAALAAAAALRAGAGLVTVATPRSVQATLVGQCALEAMTLGVADTLDGAFAAEAAETLLAEMRTRTVLAFGPGVSAAPELRRFAYRLVSECKKPVVIDADGLNCLAPWPADLRGAPERPLILTPHPGEMARLLDTTTNDVVRHRVGCARTLATAHHLYVVLKGQRTLVAAPDGGVYVNPTGNPGMATGGSGDVLTGTLAGLLAQSPRTPLEATLQAVYVHGFAADLAVRKSDERALVASDITTHLGEAFAEVEKAK
jgi:NAD(P)H-hydrate epimerase